VAGGEAHLVEVVEVEVSLAEADAGEHGVVLAVGAVGGDMEESALGPLFFEDVSSGVCAKEEIRLGEDLGDGLNFGEDVGGAIIWDAHDERSGHVALRLFLAQGKDGGAGSVGDGVGITEIRVTLLESMKGKEMKLPVRDEDQVFCVQMRAQRGDELRVESFQMALCSVKQRLLEALGVGGAHAEFGELEAEKLQEMKDAGENSDGSDVDGIAGDDGGDEAVAGRIIFDESGIGGENRL